MNDAETKRPQPTDGTTDAGPAADEKSEQAEQHAGEQDWYVLAVNGK